MFTLAHLSDWHATSLDGSRVRDFLNKRFLGWLSWQVRRHRVHQPRVLEALLEDVVRQAPDHVALTGDLTNVALEVEFEQARRWLDRLGDPARVSLVPGNHDAYVALPRARSWDRWAPFLRSDAARGPAPGPEDFPTLRVRGELAVVGLCSAVPSPPFLATGRLGAAQVERLREQLRSLGRRGLCRVVLVHHPPIDEDLAPRRRLVDSAALRSAIRDEGAELVLHGHRHRTFVGRIPGPERPVPVVGVRSASDIGAKEHKRAQYHLYAIERSDAGGWSVRARVRGWSPGEGHVVEEGELAL